MKNLWDSGLTQDPMTLRSFGFIVIVLRSAWLDSHINYTLAKWELVGEGVGVYSLSIDSRREVKHDPKKISGILPYRHMTAYMNGLFF